MALIALNPATGKTIAEYPETTEDEVGKSIQAAHDAHLEWRRSSFVHRAQLMANAASVLRARAREFVNIKTVWVA